jgi:hypothetical protein
VGQSPCTALPGTTTAPQQPAPSITTHTALSGPIMPEDSVSDEQLQVWMLSRAQFAAYNSTAFELEMVPEVAPPEALA